MVRAAETYLALSPEGISRQACPRSTETAALDLTHRRWGGAVRHPRDRPCGPPSGHVDRADGQIWQRGMAHMCGLRSASSERFSLENRMNAFIGRLGVPSSRCPGGMQCLRKASGLGLVDGVGATVASEALGELARLLSILCIDGVGRRTERRITDVASSGCLFGLGSVSFRPADCDRGLPLPTVVIWLTFPTKHRLSWRCNPYLCVLSSSSPN